MKLAAASFLAALLFAGAAAGEGPGTTPTAPPSPDAARNIETILRENPTCQSFTNGCEICRRSESGPQCSTPGTACQPKQWRCDDGAAPPDAI